MEKIYLANNMSSQFFKKTFKYCFLPLVFAFFIIIAYSSSASAATYYVAKTGNDTTGDGSVGNPWLTLQHAEDAAANGDTVHVGEGTYKENHATLHGWSVSKGIAWIADGAVTVTATGTARRVLYTSGTESVSFTGFIFDANDGIDGAKSYTVNFATGTANKTFSYCTFEDAASSLLAGVTLSNINVDNSIFNMTSATVSGLKGSYANTTISESVFNATTGTAAVRISNPGNSILFENNNFNITNSSYLWYVTSSGDFTVRGNTFNVTALSSSGGIFFDSGTGNITIDHNDFTYADNSSIFTIDGDVWDIDISNNSIISTIETAADPFIQIVDQATPSITNNTFDSQSSDAENISITSTGTNCGAVTISGNTMYSRATVGHVVRVGSEASTAGDNMLDGAVIENNVIYGALHYDSELVDVTVHSIFFGYNKNSFIRYNTVIGGGNGIIVKGDGMEYTSGGIFYNKIINSTGVSFLRVKGVRSINIDNNVMYANSIFSGDYKIIHIGKNNEGETATGVSLRNNILVGGGTSKLIYLEPSSSSGFTSDYNIFFRHNDGYIGRLGIGYSFSEWQGLGYDAHSINSDPLLTDPNNYNVTVDPTSPVINAGIDVGLLEDFVSVSVPRGVSPDIGLYELYAPDSAPSSLAQYKADGLTIIATGDLTNETAVVLKMEMSSLNSSDSLIPQVEVREVGTDFTNTATNSGIAVVYSGISVTGEISVSGLQNGTEYHWQARIANSAGNSSWISYGDNIESVADFEIDPPTVTLSVDEETIAEAAGESIITVTLSAVSGKTIMVNLAYSGTATGSGTDYTTSSAEIVISAGDISGTATITATQDLIDENNETIIIDINSITNGTELDTQQVIITINDDDCATVDNAATYNSYPTCGPATCNVGYVLSAGSCVLSGGVGGFSSPSSTGSGVANAQASGIGVSLNVGEINQSGTNVLTYITNQNNFVAPESGYNWQPSNYSFKINNFDLLNEIVTMVFSSEPKTVILAKGQTKDVDLGGDGVSDIRVTFSDIFVNRAEITIKSLVDENISTSTHSYESHLVKYIISPKVYLIKNNKKHWIRDERSFNYFNYNWFGIETIFDSTVFVDGDDIVAPNLSKFIFSRNLKIGMTGNDIKELQKYLNSQGFAVSKTGAGSLGEETLVFGPATRAALIKFQKAKKIDPAIGFFGSITRGFVNK